MKVVLLVAIVVIASSFMLLVMRSDAAQSRKRVRENALHRAFHARRKIVVQIAKALGDVEAGSDAELALMRELDTLGLTEAELRTVISTAVLRRKRSEKELFSLLETRIVQAISNEARNTREMAANLAT